MNKNIDLKRVSNKGMTFPELNSNNYVNGFYRHSDGFSIYYKFFQPLNLEDKTLVNDRFNDNSRINKAFDSIVEILSQPAIDKDFVLLKCTLPKEEWKIPTVSVKQYLNHIRYV